MVVKNEGYMRADLASPHLPCTHADAGCNDARPTALRAVANWYDVPFGAIVPKRGQANNLLVVVR